MPYYQFTVVAGSAGARRKAEVAAAVTSVHTTVTGAPAEYVAVSFTEVPPGSVFAAGQEVSHGRLLAVVRSGRTPEVKRRLITGLADAWSEVTGEPRATLGIFLQEVPGSSMLENGELLPEADQD